MNGLVNGFYRVAEWVTRLVYVNLLWIGFTIVGLGVLGLIPATTAMFAVVRKWVSGDDDIPVFQTFWGVYRDEFWKVNGLGLILVAIGYLIYVEYSILRTQESVVYYVASFGVLAQFIMYGIVVMYFFPIYVHFSLKSFSYFKWPFFLGIGHPILTIFLAVVTNAVLYFALKTLPALVVFVGGSTMAFFLTWGIAKTFPKFEKTAQEQEA